jgi:hypothetical protein
MTPNDAQNPPQAARNPSPSPDGTTQGLSGAQTGHGFTCDPACRCDANIASGRGGNRKPIPPTHVLVQQIARLERDLATQTALSDYWREVAHAEHGEALSRLERERDEARAQVERVLAALDRMDRDGYLTEDDGGVLRGHTLSQFTRSIRWALDPQARS